MVSEPVECPECEGSGLDPSDPDTVDHYCQTCGGDGFIEETA